jgi:hypothetical protein
VAIAIERIENKGDDKVFGVPMVSFCDLRLSQLEPHMKKYGFFGIGLSKQWAVRMGLNPVAYVSKQSEFTNYLISGIQSVYKYIENSKDWETLPPLSQAYMEIINVQRYIKNYRGMLYRRGVNLGEYTFADEREWRYVLPLYTEKFFPFVPPDVINDSEKKEAMNAMANQHKLSFTANEVKYLIVEKEADVAALRAYVSKLRNYRVEERDHLIARIITAEQVLADM